MRCPGCDATIFKKDHFCQNCGCRIEQNPKRSGKFARKKKNTNWVVVVLILVVIASAITALLILKPWNLLGMGGADSTAVNEADYTIPPIQCLQGEPNSLVLSMGNSQFLVGKEAEVLLTAVCSEEVTEDVTVTDERGKTLLTLENDGSGKLSGTVTILENSPRFGTLTATAGQHTSPEVLFRVTPEVTNDQVEVLAAVCQELGDAVVAEGFEDPNSEDAKQFVKEWLEKDSRVAGCSENLDYILFTTTDNLVGAYTGAQREPGYLGYAEPEDAYEDWKNNPDGDFSYVIDSKGLPTNSKAVFAYPVPSDGVIRGELGYYTDVINELANDTNMTAVIHGDQNAQGLLQSGDYVDCGFFVLFTHGGQIRRSNGSIMLLMDLCEGVTAGDLTKKLQLAGNPEGYSDIDLYGSHEIAEFNRKLYLVTVTKDASGNLESQYKVIYTAEAFMANIGNRYFDNTILFFAVCYGFSDTRLTGFVLDHGADAFIGCEKPFKTTVARYYLTLLTENMGQIYEDGRYYTIMETLGGCYPSGTEERIKQRVLETMWVTVQENRQIYGDITKDKFNANFITHMVTSPASWRPSLDETFFAGSGDLSCSVTEVDGEAISGAEVRLYHWKNHTFRELSPVTTDAEGNVTVQNIPYGIYIIEAEYNRAIKYIGFYFNSDNKKAGPIVLEFYDLSGTVTLKKTGEPISGAKVYVDCGLYGYEVSTDGSGKYKFEQLPAGTYSITASYSDMKTTVSSYLLERDSVVNLTLEKKVTLEELLPHLRLYFSCQCREYGMQLGSTLYYGKASSWDTQEANIFTEVGPWSEDMNAQITGNYSALTLCTNFATEEACVANLRNHMTDSIVNGFIGSGKRMTMYEGKLYHVRYLNAAMGDPPGMDYNSARLEIVSDTTCKVTVKRGMGGYYPDSDVFTFTYTDGRWKISQVN